MRTALRATALGCLVLACLGCRGPREGDRLSVVGDFRRVGSEPFTRVCVTADDQRDYFLVGNESRIHRRLVGYRVRVSGVLVFHRFSTPDGKRHFTEYQLTNTTVEPLR